MNEKINPQSLRPAALMRLLNTAGFGTVLPEHRLRRHRNRAGYQIGTDKTINRNRIYQGRDLVRREKDS